MATVLLAGVPKSPNLGDGLIARTLTHIIHMHGSHKVIHFDITQGEVEEGIAERAAQPSLPRINDAGLKKRATPDSLRMMKAYWIHRKKDATVGEPLKELVAQSDAVFLGGGHLLIDTYLTFPLAVKRVADEARRQRKPLHIVLVGARGPWSSPARHWFRRACKYATTITLRDEESRKFLLDKDPSLAGKTFALSDPALFTRETFEAALSGVREAAAAADREFGSVPAYGASGRGKGSRRSAASSSAAASPAAASAGRRASALFDANAVDADAGGRVSAYRSNPGGIRVVASATAERRIVGLGIMDPNELKRASEHRWERETCADWWRDAAATLLAQDCEVRVFTNGAATDNGFVEEYVKPRCEGLPHVSFYPYPSTVDALYRQIAECDAVIAQRLHACLPSAAMLKPTYAIVWDKKLSDIFTDLGLADKLVDFRIPAAQAVAAMKLTADPNQAFIHTMQRKKKEIYEQIGRMLP
ncbi:polysaccharide pyruvyl transferase family protein [Paenibacillus rhizovicinus]|uniref:Polysaccharide pyruvyl transferase family protein n=1 Tax=Paenibacillus rhizovicinus TaxID=2704463 RepID=A0A6C0P9K2_9BACL|nr:polysaccharide pyruvyl transferase family protein [Paenibacillus rhizovicinus]QHW34313.1 polysaccharide pyruvyl transferase family protein [Paenibacillus rhizovicinus]